MDGFSQMAEEPGPGRVCTWSGYTAPISNSLFSLFLGLFLSTLDTSIIATALVTIVTELDDFQRSPWVVVAYLLLYMSRSALFFWRQPIPNSNLGLAVAFARLSDVYGRKTMVLIAWIIFTAFSIGCGAAQTMTQL